MHGHAVGQYLKSSVAMNTYNRAVTIHGTYDVTLQNNVAYNTMGVSGFGNTLERH
jgi:cell migration-inducing and hyaluronan-binding protein